jgi:hypothetical protein
MVAKKLNFEYKKADYADIISSIGVATGMIYEEKERTINNPTPQDVTQLITAVKEEAIRKNASPDSLSVQSEYVSDRSILRVTAIGNVTLDLNNNGSKELRQEELFEIARDLFQFRGNISLKYKLGNYYIFANSYKHKKLFFNTNKQSILVLDKYGRVRLSLDNGQLIHDSSTKLLADLPSIISKFSRSDLSPTVYLLDGFQLLDFSSLTANEQVIQAITEQLDKIDSDVLLIIKQ